MLCLTNFPGEKGMSRVKDRSPAASQERGMSEEREM